MASDIEIKKLKYVGKGQVVRVSDGALVSPRWLVLAYNDLLEIADDFRRTLNKVLDALVARGNKEADDGNQEV